MSIDLTKDKFIIVAGSKVSEIERFSLAELREYLKRVMGAGPQIKTDWEVENKLCANNMILLGSTDSNSITRTFANDNIFSPETRDQGYVLKTAQNPYAEGKWVLIIAGKDERGTLYGVRDLCHYYLEEKGWHIVISEIDIKDAPTMKTRGLFTWDYFINDPYKYVDRMSEWKLNTLLIWNEPYLLERKDIIEYAHCRAIKVIVGVGINSWGTIGAVGVHTGTSWYADAAPEELKRSEDGFVLCSSEEKNKKWMSDYVIKIVKELDNIDGIYFQTGLFDFDDCQCSKCKELSTGERLSMQINLCVEAVADERPDLWISYGIGMWHLKDEEIYPHLKKIDKRATPMIEGGFPFPAHEDQKALRKVMPEGRNFGYVRPHIYMQGQMNQGFRERRGKNIVELIERIKIASSFGVEDVFALVETPEYSRRPLFLPIVFSEAVWSGNLSYPEFSKKLLKIRRIADLDQRVSDPDAIVLKKDEEVLLVKRLEGTREEGGWIWGYLRVNAWLKADVCDLLSEQESAGYSFELPHNFKNGLTEAKLIIHGAKDDIEENKGDYYFNIWINKEVMKDLKCPWKKGKKMIHKATEPHNELCKPSMFLNLSDWEINLPIDWLSSNTKITLEFCRDDGLVMYNKIILKLSYKHESDHRFQ